MIFGTRSNLGPKDSKDLSRVSFVVSAGRPTLKASRSRNFQHSFAPVSLIARVSRFACHVVCPLSSFLKILSCFFVNVLSEHPSKTRCRGSERWWTCPEIFNSLGGTSKVRSLRTKRKAQTFRLRRTHSFRAQRHIGAK